MGFFSVMFSAPQNSGNDNIPAIMLIGAIDQINRGILPMLNTEKQCLPKENNVILLTIAAISFSWVVFLDLD